MGQVRVAINGRTYSLGCDDGEEARVERLATVLDRRVAEMAANVGQVGDTRLLLMAALLVIDELTVAQEDLRALRAELDQLRGVSSTAESENKSLNQLIKRLESIAANVENA